MNSRYNFDFSEDDDDIGGFRPSKKQAQGEAPKRKAFDDGAKKERNDKRKKFVRPREEAVE